jgi:hypothetical protein
VTKWSGTTRPITAEPIPITDRIVITPPGAFSQSDWALAPQIGFSARGGLDTSGSVDPTNPNMLVGANCLSFKNDWSRSTVNGFSLANVTNSLIVNGRVKLYTMDGVDLFSIHRVWAMDTLISDPTQTWNHMDTFQVANFSVPSTTKYYFGNYLVNNEALQNTDPSNYFPQITQGLDQTDAWQWGGDWSNNVVNTQLNSFAAQGARYGVYVHNTVIGGALRVTNQGKDPGTTGLPSGNLIADNAANGIVRGNTSAGFCDVLTQGNLSIPFLPIGNGQSNTSVGCDLTGAFLNSNVAGLYQGVMAWAQLAWDTTGGPTASLFTDFAPLAMPVAGQPGYGIPSANVLTNCNNLSIITPIECPLGGAGAINLRPNHSFAGTEQPVTGTGRSTCCATPILPSDQPDGVYWVLWGMPPPAVQIWETCGGGTVTCTGTQFTTSGGQKWMQIATTYNPGLLNNGVPLGAQSPIADHNGDAFDPTHPAIGAYE